MTGNKQRVGIVGLTGFLIVLFLAASGFCANAEPPGAAYIFPAGGQRGTKIEARVGGFYFHGKAKLHLGGDHVAASPVISEVKTIWFEGPMIFQPDSQKKEDYPKDHLARIAIDGDAPLGIREWFCETDQGTTPNLQFVIGDLPEIVEQEVDGDPIPRTVTLPVTINGRIFPREDVDVWEFEAAEGEAIVCEVTARGLGYPFDPALAVIGPDGRSIDVAVDANRGDPELEFIASHKGKYQLKITDSNFLGLQDYVYRLTIRRGHRITEHFPLGGEAGQTIDVTFSTSDGKTHVLPVALPETPGPVPVPVKIGAYTVMLPFHVHRAADGDRMVDGKIDKPGKVDTWPIDLAEGESFVAEVFAHDLGSRLDSLIAITDAEGKELVSNDDRSGGQPDSRVAVTPKKAGKYFVKVCDKFSRRGGPDFAYRLRLHRPSPTGMDFDLTMTRGPVNIPRITEAEAAAEKPPGGTAMAVQLVPIGPWKSDITLSVEGLPAGIELEGTKLANKGKRTANLIFRTKPDTPLTTTEITIVGTADLGEGKTLTRRAKFPVRISIVPKVPFKYIGRYWFTTDHPGGSELVKSYKVERTDGFAGPLRAMLADRQVRHLQGITGPVVNIPAGSKSFDYPITFPPSVELGRTTRVQLMLVGEVDGRTVSYTTGERNEQIITVTTSGLLKIVAETPTVAVTTGGSVEIPISVLRDQSLANRPVRLKAVIPAHFRGVSAAPVEVPGGETKATFKIHFAADAAGPFNMPMRILAETVDPKHSPNTAETEVELVVAKALD